MKLSKGVKLLLLGIFLIVLDQVVKVLVKTNMSLGEVIPVFGNWFRICFVENEGMAFGMKFGGALGKFLLSAFRIVLSGFLIWWISKLLKKDGVPAGVPVALSVITAGAIIGRALTARAHHQPAQRHNSHQKNFLHLFLNFK